MTVSFTPVFPNSRMGVSPAFGLGGRALSPVMPRPANTVPTKVLRRMKGIAL